MAIPYPSDILIPYLIEPVGEFLNAWGPPVLFPIAHWMAWITIGLSSIMIIKTIWWDISTGGSATRAQAAIERRNYERERRRVFNEAREKAAANPVGENQTASAI